MNGVAGIQLKKARRVNASTLVGGPKEGKMLIADLINSCSNDKIAQAAVASIGGGFAERVRATASENGVNAGCFVSVIVRDFGRRANDKTRLNLQQKIAGADQPLLFALRHIVESALADTTLFFNELPEFERRLSSDCFGAAERFQ
jgi:hypothetical protein